FSLFFSRGAPKVCLRTGGFARPPPLRLSWLVLLSQRLGELSAWGGRRLARRWAGGRALSRCAAAPLTPYEPAVRCTRQKEAGFQTAKPNLPSPNSVVRFLKKSSWSASESLTFTPSRTNTVAARANAPTSAWPAGMPV